MGKIASQAPVVTPGLHGVGVGEEDSTWTKFSPKQIDSILLQAHGDREGGKNNFLFLMTIVVFFSIFFLKHHFSNVFDRTCN